MIPSRPCHMIPGRIWNTILSGLTSQLSANCPDMNWSGTPCSTLTSNSPLPLGPYFSKSVVKRNSIWGVVHTFVFQWPSSWSALAGSPPPAQIKKYESVPPYYGSPSLLLETVGASSVFPPAKTSGTAEMSMIIQTANKVLIFTFIESSSSSIFHPEKPAWISVFSNISGYILQYYGYCTLAT